MNLTVHTPSQNRKAIFCLWPVPCMIMGLAAAVPRHVLWTSICSAVALDGRRLCLAIEGLRRKIVAGAALDKQSRRCRVRRSVP